MAITLPGRTVVFDYGEVISRAPDPAARHALVDLAGTDPEAFHESYERHRDALDSGDLSVVAYWNAIARDTGADWSLTRIHQLWAIDFPAWLTPEPGTLDIIGELRDGGTPLAVLSNAGFDYGAPLRFSPVGSLFDAVFVSAELHDLKPNASIYQHVLDALGISPAEMVFIDNKQINVEAAEALGITGHIFTTPDALRSFLVGLAPE